jgi:hypothetical protein
MKKRPIVGVLNAVEASGANVISDATIGQWSVVKTSAGMVPVIGPFRTGKIRSIESFNPQREIRQLVVIGTTEETIVASTRYKVEIGNQQDSYETEHTGPSVYAYTSAAALSGTASTDRTNVYTALVTKINAYAGNNVTAYGLTKATYTGGTSTGDAATNFVVGETVTQETSTCTAKVAKCTIATGTFAADSAAGTIWLYDLSSYTNWLTTAKTLTAAGTAAATTTTPATTNCVVTVTNATTLHYQGIVILDDAGYFTSKLGRGGISWVDTTQGFTAASIEVAITGQYQIGIGSAMLALKPVFDVQKQIVISGRLEYELTNGDAFDSTKTYRKYVVRLADGDENAMSGDVEAAEQEVVLYVDYADSDLGDFNTPFIALT